jgi:hypothetical protein
LPRKIAAIHRRGQVDALGRQQLHERLRDDPAAVIAACRAAVSEVPGLEDVDLEVETDGLSHVEQEVREERSRRPATDDCDARAIGELQEVTLLVATASGGVARGQQERGVAHRSTREND